MISSFFTFLLFSSQQSVMPLNSLGLFIQDSFLLNLLFPMNGSLLAFLLFSSQQSVVPLNSQGLFIQDSFLLNLLFPMNGSLLAFHFFHCLLSVMLLNNLGTFFLLKLLLLLFPLQKPFFSVELSPFSGLFFSLICSILQLNFNSAVSLSLSKF